MPPEPVACGQAPVSPVTQVTADGAGRGDRTQLIAAVGSAKGEQELVREGVGGIFSPAQKI